MLDLGPRAGTHAGKIIASGTPKDIIQSKNSLTGKYLTGKAGIKIKNSRRKGVGKFLTLIGKNLFSARMFIVLKKE